METDKSLIELAAKFKDQPWFFDVGSDNFGRLIVYATTMSLDVFSSVPDTFDGKNVLVHFAQSKTATKDQFKANPIVTAKAPVFLTQPLKVVEIESEFEPDLALLTQELDRLEKICGSNILQDIFYETHDGKNAVTDLSSKYPDVRFAVEKLYNQYGFDVIYEELDG